MISRLLGMLSADMAIDLGTANTLVYVKGRGIVLNEPSVVAIADVRGKKQVLAVGDEAKMMLGRTPGNIQAIRPLRDGVIADFEVAEEMIKHFIRKVHNRRSFASPQVIICVPSGSTAVERRAIQESAESAGARRVYPDRGADGGGHRRRPAGDRADRLHGRRYRRRHHRGRGAVPGRHRLLALGPGRRRQDGRGDHRLHPKRNHNLLVGEGSAERIKKEIGSACPPEDGEGEHHGDQGPRPDERRAQGARSSPNGRSPRPWPSRSAPSSRPSRWPSSTRRPELAADIVDKGIVLTGGGALLGNLDYVLRVSTGLPVSIADDPLSCVALGTGRCLEEMKTLKNVLISMY